jgi:hypothetical protein
VTEGSKPRMGRLQWLLVIIPIVISILALFGASNIASFFSRVASPPSADYNIESLSVPIAFNSGFLLSLSPSPDYYVTTSTGISTSYLVYIGSPLQFTVSFDNMGKMPVAQPNVTIYVVDPYWREWASWNQSLTDEQFSNGFIVAYHFPTLDQK